VLNEFHAKVGNWDKNQVHVERSEAIAEALLQMVPIDNRTTALEFGAGIIKSCQVGITREELLL
jgi:hypothetical protein